MKGIVCGWNDGTDRISELPNHILISIICRLTLQEATATSVLSTRWRYLHTYVIHLDFPPFKPNVHSDIGHHYVESEILDESKRFLEHVNMINGVLDSYRGGDKVKELRLCMYRMRMEACNMEKWVQFALTKENIEIIDIKMPHLPIGYSNFQPSGRYCFGLSELMKKTTKSMLPAIKCLKQLTLHWVKVSDLDFDILISNFLALETLSIRDTFRIKKATILGHPKLMHLEMPCESLEIRNVANLASLRVWYLSREATIEMENIPKLTKFYSCESHHSLQHPTLYSKIPSHIRDQLQAIHLESDGYWDPLNGMLPPPFQFVNVKHLELEVESWFSDDPEVFKFRSLIVGCSSLEKLKIKVWARLPASTIKFGKRRDPYGNYGKKLSPKLKELEMEGYAGSESEFQVAAFVTRYALNLERVLIVVACAATKRIRRRLLARAQEDFRLITPPSLHLQFI